ncbi:hypothetical protein FRC08_012970 [Ceratobasidium sp. 394]|nr:hypothetical protein FRC08_012970 [Ceratobasidium sp. 394]
MDRTKRISGTFSPSWGKKKNATSYFPDPQDEYEETPSAVRSPFASPADRRTKSYGGNGDNRLDGFDTHFESDFKPRAPRSTGSGRKSGDITDYETRMRQNASPYSAYGGPSPTQTQFADISAQQRLELSRNNSWKSGKSGSFFNGRGKDKDKDRDGGAYENGRQNSSFGVSGWAAKFSGRDNDRKTSQFDLMTGDDDDRDPFSSSPRDYPSNGRVRESFDSGNGSHATNGNGTKRGFYPGLVETDLNTAAKDANVWEDDPFGAKPARQPTPKISTKPGLTGPQTEGVARAIALFDFVAQESGDLSFNKGDVIIVLKKTNSIDDWWTGKLNGKQGIFPANFTEVV